MFLDVYRRQVLSRVCDALVSMNVTLECLQPHCGGGGDDDNQQQQQQQQQWYVNWSEDVWEQLLGISIDNTRINTALMKKVLHKVYLDNLAASATTL